MANYFGTPQLIECKGICVLSLARGSELRGTDVICILSKKSREIFLSIQPGYMLLGWPAWIAFFFLFFFIYIVGSVGQIVYREYIVFRDSDISCSLATVSGVVCSVLRAQ